ncbi:type II toxin-antitoxin system prevent-host-death family antitoxin [Streptomyces pseudovenezuelae]|uniref:type II toxin-antitoxin system prevent-host-death family antitoxin n=1 Tax=Streptomyces pseudovenezuelae TaxID=67350 RepID=UPI0036E19EB2
MTYSESRARYAEVLNSVTDDREEVVITQAGREPTQPGQRPAPARVHRRTGKRWRRRPRAGGRRIRAANEDHLPCG